ncbi:kelch repeat and BTB domain-containing protein 8-like [Anneissia japonica]|uniref:kelch repeat and BTB domain-containing protein 8-like n=1 Tax=Anneissia japonica TaxID=1529436 RepID=UPI00142582E6|nr:kelch repeat and BTB domain-containing protein 8-like [Anneissia japonica]XP_033105881.1 kelch repeat and BTB domain-containing protein 8-like [Anneissia japonica]
MFGLNAILYTDANHGQNIAVSLKDMRNSKVLTDLTLRAQNKEIHCHRNILAASSPYFMAMFTSGLRESSMTSIDINDIDEIALEIIIDFMYSGCFSINESTVQDLFMACNLFQISQLVEYCVEYLERCMNISNCIGIIDMAKTYSCEQLEEVARDYINYNIMKVCKEEEFLNASKSLICEIISSENLNVEHEQFAFNTLVEWIKFDEKLRSNYTADLLACISLGKIDEQYLRDEWNKNTFLTKNLAPWNIEKGPKETLIKPDRLGTTKRELLLCVGRKNCEQALCQSFECNISYSIALPVICHAMGVQCVVTNNNDIYIATDDYRDKSFYKYSHIQGNWIEMSPMLHGRRTLKCVNDKIFTIAGMMSEWYINSIECYNPLRNEWTFKSEIPHDVLDYCTAVYRDSMYIFSGSRTMCYNTTTDTWTPSLAPMPTPRLCPGIVTVGSEIWTIAGESPGDGVVYSAKPMVEVEAYIPESNTWERKPPLNVAIKYCSACMYNSNLYVCGLRLSMISSLNSRCSMFVYDSVKEEWTDLGLIPLLEVTGMVTAKMFVKSLKT